MRIAGKIDNRWTTKLLIDVLKGIDFTGKAVLDTACADGVFALFAEARGAQHVIAVDRELRAEAVSLPGPALKT